jgi:hypothetical protein
MIKTWVDCCRCGESDDKHAKTGARIDGRYYCQGCYDAEMDEVENKIIEEVLG